MADVESALNDPGIQRFINVSDHGRILNIILPSIELLELDCS